MLAGMPTPSANFGRRSNEIPGLGGTAMKLAGSVRFFIAGLPPCAALFLKAVSKRGHSVKLEALLPAYETSRAAETFY